MRRGFLLPALRLAALAMYIASYYGLLYFSIYSFLGEGAADSPFGPTSILMILIAAPGLPLLRYWISEVQDRHRTYLMVRWGLMLLYVLIGIPVALGLIEYDGPFNIIAVGLGLVLSLLFFLFAAAVAFPLYFFATGLLLARPGHVHAGSFLAIAFFPLTTFRLFLAGSDDFGNFFQAWMILAGFVLAWDWGDISTKLTRAMKAVERGLAYNPYELGLGVYLASGLAWIGVAFALINAMHTFLVERTVLGGPTSYAHVFFWMAMLTVGVLAIGFLVRYQRLARPDAEPQNP